MGITIKYLIMKELKLEQYENIIGGSVDSAIGGLCAAAGIASIVALTNWWNPVGWVAAALVVADVSCVTYAVASHQ
jgi:hypothetical protein